MTTSMARRRDGERPFESGEIVLYRRVRAGRILHAMPLRVVSDEPGLTVLYLAPDTAFKSMRTADGGKVRDFSRPSELTDVVWAGGSFIRLLRPNAWHAVDIEFLPGGQFDGWYVNFQTPARRRAGGFDIDDLVLDVIVMPDRSWQLKDEEDFELAISGGHVSAAAAARVRSELIEVTGMLERWDMPFADESWPSWTPLASWLARPELPPDWDAL
ncbi:MAG TPA: DUF402 domain-containing protein [Streptosporangiaceae bacterium]|jgi:hypothetical protein